MICVCYICVGLEKIASALGIAESADLHDHEDDDHDEEDHDDDHDHDDDDDHAHARRRRESEHDHETTVASPDNSNIISQVNIWTLFIHATKHCKI